MVLERRRVEETSAGIAQPIDPTEREKKRSQIRQKTDCAHIAPLLLDNVKKPIMMRQAHMPTIPHR
jgi:hypothetical protein